MKDMDRMLLTAAQDSYNAVLAKFVACEAALRRAKAEAREDWIKLYILMSGQKWTDTPPTYEEAARAWDERHGLTR